MQRYGNRNGNSGVVAYGLGRGWISVEFAEGAVYLYDGHKPGAKAVLEMQRLATRGEGLSTYISRVVRDNYAKRLR